MAMIRRSSLMRPTIQQRLASEAVPSESPEVQFVPADSLPSDWLAPRSLVIQDGPDPAVIPGALPDLITAGDAIATDSWVSPVSFFYPPFFLSPTPSEFPWLRPIGVTPLVPSTGEPTIPEGREEGWQPSGKDDTIPASTTPFHASYGYGLVDAAAAVSRSLGQAFLPPVSDRDEADQQLAVIQAPEVWAQGYRGQGVVVAVVDSGVDINHFELNRNRWINPGEIPDNGLDDEGNGFVDDWQGWDFIDRDNLPLDQEGHGTHIAGTIAAANDGLGVTGVAYEAVIMPVRVLDETGSGSSSGVAEGIRYAMANGADVINLSLGGEYSAEIATAIAEAVDRGVVVVMAAGNEASGQPGYPARFASRYGLAVGAVDDTLRLASFSNRAGSQPLDYVVAPGVEVRSTAPGNGYTTLSGTSMATAYVSGVAALLLSANPTLSPAQVETLITQTANPGGVTI